MKKLSLPGAARYRVQYLFRPGRYLGARQLAVFVGKLRDTAATCFDELPNYQVMVGTSAELSDKVLAVAWRADGAIAGFCSTVLLPVPGVGEVLHLGLTCVRPEDRRQGLTHMLTKKAVTSYLLRRKPIGKLWVTNCAAVLSSLGNVALHFDDVYPSPIGKTKPTLKHLQIARVIESRYREKMYIGPEPMFDYENFVFRGSVLNTVFQKDGADRRFHHRKEPINEFYKKIMVFEAGDEVLQVGSVSTLTAMKYQVFKKKRQQQMLVLEKSAA